MLQDRLILRLIPLGRFMDRVILLGKPTLGKPMLLEAAELEGKLFTSNPQLEDMLPEAVELDINDS